MSLFSAEDEVMLLPAWRGVVRCSLDDGARATIGFMLGLNLAPFTVVELRREGLYDAGSSLINTLKSCNNKYCSTLLQLTTTT